MRCVITEQGDIGTVNFKRPKDSVVVKVKKRKAARNRFSIIVVLVAFSHFPLAFSMRKIGLDGGHNMANYYTILYNYILYQFCAFLVLRVWVALDPQGLSPSAEYTVRRFRSKMNRAQSENKSAAGSLYRHFKAKNFKRTVFLGCCLLIFLPAAKMIAAYVYTYVNINISAGTSGFHTSHHLFAVFALVDAGSIFIMPSFIVSMMTVSMNEQEFLYSLKKQQSGAM